MAWAMRDGADAAWGAPPGGSHNPAAADKTSSGPASACQVNRRRQSGCSATAPTFSAASSTTRDSSGPRRPSGRSRDRDSISDAVSTRSLSLQSVIHLLERADERLLAPRTQQEHRRRHRREHQRREPQEAGVHAARARASTTPAAANAV